MTEGERVLELIQKAAGGDVRALGAVFEHVRGRLRRTVQLRIDLRLSGRLDPSDVVQDAFLDAMRRLPEYVSSPDVPLSLWLRTLTLQRLVDVQRHHLGAKMRDAGREVTLDGRSAPHASAVSLAAVLVDPAPSPDSEIVHRERRLRVQAALEAMDDIDREVLAMRHFELLSNNDVAATLQISPTAASNRYVRAIQRLKQVLSESDDSSQ
jgi:RNA polymerase sigma-70 factor (ECF subfamily)